jgi:hypothetical protein
MFFTTGNFYQGIEFWVWPTEYPAVLVVMDQWQMQMSPGITYGNTDKSVSKVLQLNQIFALVT